MRQADWCRSPRVQTDIHALCGLQVKGQLVIAKAWHLSKRFFQVVFAKPLTPDEQSEVAQWLRPEEATLFWNQQVADQRHGLETARKLAAARPGAAAIIRAGLLHDIGKSESRLSALGRTFATLADLVGLPLSARFRRYRDHGPIGAAALRAVGAEALVVEFAEHHPGGPPDGIDADAWTLLLGADDD